MVAFSVIITEASIFLMSGPAPPAVSVFADPLSMMLRRFVTCWKVPETRWCRGGAEVAVAGSAPTPRPSRRRRGSHALATIGRGLPVLVQTEKPRPRLGHTLKESMARTGRDRKAGVGPTFLPPSSSGSRGFGSSVSSAGSSFEPPTASVIPSTSSSETRFVKSLVYQHNPRDHAPPRVTPCITLSPSVWAEPGLG